MLFRSATEIQKHLAEKVTFTDTSKANADFNRDGMISILDATEVQKYIVR